MMPRNPFSPSTLLIDPAAPRPVITVIGYGPQDHVVATLAHPEELGPHLERWPVVWVNVDGLGDREVLTRLGEMFAIHRLALEDVVNVRQRAKVEPYQDHLFIVARMVHLLEGRLTTEQVSFIVRPGLVVSFQEHVGDSFDAVRQRIRAGHGRIRGAGADYLCYALIDALIDAYFPVLEHFGDRLEELEEQVLSRPQRRTVERIYDAKRELLLLRRAIWPHREAIGSLMRDESPLVAPETRVYLRDCYDHCVQIADMVETFRELTSGLTDLYLSSLSHRMNEVMKVLTIFAAIFIPLTFIAGIYGMNFERMPELHWSLGYPLALLLMLLVAGGMLLYFWRRGWISFGEQTKSGRDEETE